MLEVHKSDYMAKLKVIGFLSSSFLIFFLNIMFHVLQSYNIRTKGIWSEPHYRKSNRCILEMRQALSQCLFILGAAYNKSLDTIQSPEGGLGASLETHESWSIYTINGIFSSCLPYGEK